MKKLATLALSLFLLSSASPVKAQLLEPGDNIFDVYYGMRLTKRVIAFSAYGTNDYPNLDMIDDNSTYNSIGTIGLRYERMVSQKTGFGVEFNYENYTVTTIDDSSGYRYNGAVNTFRLMPRFNFHFDVGDHFDGYFGVAAGYKRKSNVVTTNDPFDLGKDEVVTGMALRLALGGRYFFTENVAVNLEMGLFGGAFLHTGITYKFL